MLDIGTGTGLLARNFAENGCVVSGVDISDSQIAVAKELAGRNNLKIDFSSQQGTTVAIDSIRVTP